MATDKEGFQENCMQEAPTEFLLDANNILDWKIIKQVNKETTERHNSKQNKEVCVTN